MKKSKKDIEKRVVEGGWYGRHMRRVYHAWDEGWVNDLLCRMMKWSEPLTALAGIFGIVSLFIIPVLAIEWFGLNGWFALLVLVEIAYWFLIPRFNSGKERFFSTVMGKVAGYALVCVLCGVLLIPVGLVMGLARAVEVYGVDGVRMFLMMAGGIVLFLWLNSLKEVSDE